MSNRLISLFSIGKTEQIGQQTTNNYGLDEEAVKAVIDNTVEELSKELQGVEKNNEALIAGVQNELCRQIFELKKGQTDVCEAVRKNFEYLEANRTKFVLQIIETIKESISPAGSMEKALRSFCEQSERAADAQYERFMEWQEKQIEARRRNLFEVTHEENIREELVLFYARKLLELVPGDVLARFYLLVSENNAQAVNAYLDEMDVALQGKETVCAALDYLLEPLEPRMEPSLRRLAERAFQEGVFKRGEYVRYITKIEGGRSFDPLRQWDLFIAYSSKDRKEVEKLVEELEEQEIECFVAYRDLPHGRGAGGQRYWNDLKCAMGNSRGLVFVSTPNSRSRSCDAIEREDKSVDDGMGELPYYGKNFSREEKLRIEYRPESDDNTPTPRSVEQMLKRFFGEVNYCQTPEEVAEVASRYLFPQLYDEEEPSETSEEQRKAEEAAEAARLSEERRKAEEARKAEEQRKAEEAEAARLADEQRKAEEAEATRLADEQRKAEAARRTEERRKKPWLAPDYPTLKNYDKSEFKIEGAMLKKYLKENVTGEAKIPFGVTSIGDWAFSGCSGLTSIIIPDSVKLIGKGAFKSCSGLTSIIIPDSVKLIDRWTFWNCSGLTSIAIPARVSSIGDRAFSGCSGLTSITIPNSVTSIGGWAFDSCSGLTSITIPKSVTSIGKWAFFGCKKLAIYCAIQWPPSGWDEGWNLENRPVVWGCGMSSKKSDQIKQYDKSEFEIEGTELKNYLKKDFIGEVKIPLGVTSIGWAAFRGCSRLTSIIIPDGVNTIEWGAFSGCCRLMSINIPDSVSSIEKYAFDRCNGLTSIIIPKSVKSIGSWAFEGCTNLTIYCEASEQPSGWASGWNPDPRRVVWGYKK